MIFTIVLCAAAALLPASSTSVHAARQPQSGMCGDYLAWKFDGGVLEISYTGSSAADTGDMWDYTFAPAPWLHFARDIVSVTIGDGVARIGNDAFFGCSSMKSITLPNSLVSIGSWAFYGCSSLERIDIPTNVAFIGNSAFFDCRSLENILIPHGVNYIDNGVFNNCERLKNVVLPGVRESFLIYQDAFMGAGDFTVMAPVGSPVIYEAMVNNLRYAYLPDLSYAEMVWAGGGAFYQNYPGEATVMTHAPLNYGLQFNVSPRLPAGLYLADGSDSDLSGRVPGTIYGTPMDTVANAAYTLSIWPSGLPSDMFSRQIRFELEVLPPQAHPDYSADSSQPETEDTDAMESDEGREDPGAQQGQQETEDADATENGTGRDDPDAQHGQPEAEDDDAMENGTGRDAPGGPEDDDAEHSGVVIEENIELETQDDATAETEPGAASRPAESGSQEAAVSGGDRIAEIPAPFDRTSTQNQATPSARDPFALSARQILLIVAVAALLLTALFAFIKTKFDGRE